MIKTQNTCWVTKTCHEQKSHTMITRSKKNYTKKAELYLEKMLLKIKKHTPYVVKTIFWGIDKKEIIGVSDDIIIP